MLNPDELHDGHAGTDAGFGYRQISAPDLDAALAWGRKAACATTPPIEVRPFMGEAEA